MKDSNEARFLILKAAFDEISEIGIGNARTSSIAKRAGVTSGLLHYYYGTKQNLINAIISHIFDQGLADEIAVIPYNRECSPVEKIQAILYSLYSLIKYDLKKEIYNIIKFYHQLMAEEKTLLNNITDHYNFFAERYIIHIVKEGIKQNYFSIKYPSFFAMDIMASITRQVSMYYTLQGRPEEKEFYPEPFSETYGEYLINSSLRKIIIPEKFSKIKELAYDLKQAIDTYVDIVSKKKIISSWHIVVRLIIKLFNDEYLLTGER